MQCILRIAFLVPAFISVAALAAALKTNDVDSYDGVAGGLARSDDCDQLRRLERRCQRQRAVRVA